MMGDIGKAQLLSVVRNLQELGVIRLKSSFPALDGMMASSQIADVTGLDYQCLLSRVSLVLVNDPNEARSRHAKWPS